MLFLFLCITSAWAQEQTSAQATDQGGVETQEQTSAQAPGQAGVEVQGQAAGQALKQPRPPSQVTPDKNDIPARIEALQKQVDKLEQEAAARKKLQMSEEEKKKSETEVLTAVGREYTLLGKGKFELEYRLSYDYNALDQIGEFLDVEHTYDHTITHTITSTYGIRNNFSLNMSLPIVYRYNQIGTSTEKDTVDLGDISAGFQYQPIKQTKDGSSFIINAIVSTPTGSNPYKINSDTEISTGNGVYLGSLGVNWSKPIDPMVIFGNIGYIYKNPLSDLHTHMTMGESSVELKRVELGDSISMGFGFGYSISYLVSMSQQLSLSYVTGSKYRFTGTTSKSGAYTSAAYIIGSGWRVGSKTNIYTSLEIGLTPDRPNFGISLRVPLNFVF